MVAEDDGLRCNDCVWAVKALNTTMVYCKWHQIYVYGGSMPCPNFERYYKPF